MSSVTLTTTTTTTSTPPKPTPKDEPQEQIYTPWRLFIYDIWVLGIVSTLAWGCRISTYLIPLFRSNVGKKHLDIGAGTGYYLNQARIPSTTQLTIVDNETHALNVALARCKHPSTQTHGIVTDILQPSPFPETYLTNNDKKFDSVSMYYLLHCLPVPVASKCKIFTHLKKYMTEDGVVHGANVLGKGVRKDNWFARIIRRGCLNHGVFHNEEDNAYEFERALRENFWEVETWVVGSVFVFRAKRPILDA
ncbi:hypothetical protein AnigIFM60653_007635 [Aspergillus niger]|uniref:O-methyltransferase adaD n=3 Tax=Aspergillus niger TaxID=5061 RepID=ADAD_ASPNC|nr:uncharacterized protein An11g07340 [Aspergillus niger]XP_025459882.1 S-adenosyl-L-methionine dependent methyltransferase [Aspergillus niger CBS 101883]A2QX25.1 RecName: Full=O-methyltransferase adaD; AltName: Full=2-acetyl-2-decarboxamidoanthrotainin biosynthesis cluster protein D [Aspergillus niger CBS 513.88]RDH16450.1 S-adenosyl-L-methionine dependent methyltransferase [Aspergillus niger ATCC 13496]KAI2812148.1 hypothetical protein CBS115989_10737 [Aspergillus niger]KAI2843172.1 hypothet|eukprot:XP_001394708.1 hypothetical protein ANI_1_2246094 [Aspergillus niger CBS 513.88]